MAEVQPARGSAVRAIGAAVAYLVVAVWSVRVILPAPSTTLPFPANLEEQGEQFITGGDQHFVVTQIYGNARRLMEEPGRLFENGFCYPTRRPVTLGEHMLGNGLVAVVPYALGAGPVLTMNVVTVATLWLAALAMYALAYSWTRSAGAAFVAGLLFAFHPSRVGNPAHPFVHGNQWAPLVLLFAHRLFARERWRDAAGLGLFLGLQLLESFYQVVALVVLGGTYGLYLMVRYRHRLLALAPKLLACLIGAAAVAAVVLGPYLETRETWGVLSRGHLFLLLPRQFLPGSDASPGLVTLLLAGVGLLDRCRGPRRALGYDPRLIYLLGGALVFWTVVRGVLVPGLGVWIPSLSRYLVYVIPGIDAGRALPVARLALFLVLAFLAGYGVLALIEHRGRIGRAVLTGALAMAALLDVFWPPLNAISFGRSVALTAHEVKPAPDLLRAYRSAPWGPVLDVPLSGSRLPLAASEYVFLSAYHGRPTAACYNSYSLPIVQDVEEIASRVPEAPAIDALYALGFRGLVVHEERLGPTVAAVLGGKLAEADEHVIPVGNAPEHALFRITSTVPIDDSLTALATATTPAAVAQVVPPAAEVSFTFRNGEVGTYRHPEPIEPTRLDVSWYTAPDALALRSSVRALLPLALARGEETTRALEVPVPETPGEYEVTVAPASAPGLVIARRRVRVVPPP